MPTYPFRAPQRRACPVVLLGLTLLTSAIHFVDNAFRLDLYPGPVWLTRNVVLATWAVVAAAAYVTYRTGTRTAYVAYGLVGFAGLVHYFMPHGMRLPLRCEMTIGGEALTSLLLIAYALLQPRGDVSGLGLRSRMR